MVLSDFFDSILKRKVRYFLFFIQMIVIFIVIQYTFNLVNGYRLFNIKLDEISSDKTPAYFAFQDPDSSEMPDCSLEEYKNFKDDVNEKCGNSAFSFGISDIVLKTKVIPNAFISFEDNEHKYYSVTYISENFLNYYHIDTSVGRTFSKPEYDQESSNYIPILVGSKYSAYLKVGDILDEKYEVKGILKKNSSYLDRQLDSKIVYLDNQIVIPMIYQAEEWGGCYVNQLVFSTDNKAIIDEIKEIIKQYGFKDYTIRDMKEQIVILREGFWTEFSFMCVMFVTLFMLCIFSMISMLQHLIEEQKTEFGIYMLCGASKLDICIKISMPIVVILLLASVPSIAMCESVQNYLFQILVVLLLIYILTSFPLRYWLRKPISELKKERE